MSAPFQPAPRRPHFVELVDWAEAKWVVGVGLDRAGRAIEIFIDPGEQWCAVDAVVSLVHEASITASHLLQHGVGAGIHADRLRGIKPGLLTLALDAAATVEMRHGADVRAVEQMIDAAIRAGQAAP